MKPMIKVRESLRMKVRDKLRGEQEKCKVEDIQQTKRKFDKIRFNW